MGKDTETSDTIRGPEGRDYHSSVNWVTVNHMLELIHDLRKNIIYLESELAVAERENGELHHELKKKST